MTMDILSLVRLGPPIADVVRMAGHSSPALTLAVYTHSDGAALERARQLL
jgi:hypothetical protein